MLGYIRSTCCGTCCFPSVCNWCADLLNVLMNWLFHVSSCWSAHVTICQSVFFKYEIVTYIKEFPERVLDSLVVPYGPLHLFVKVFVIGQALFSFFYCIPWGSSDTVVLLIYFSSNDFISSFNEGWLYRIPPLSRIFISTVVFTKRWLVLLDMPAYFSVC